MWLTINNNKQERKIMEILKYNETFLKGKAVKVLDENGGNLGIMPFDIAFKKAENDGLNLILVNKDCIPPICKCINWGKYEYEQKKKRKINIKANNIKSKEIELTYKIASNDLDTKVNKVLEWVSKGYRIKVSMRIPFRENNNMNTGVDIMKGLMEKVKFSYPNAKQEMNIDGGEIKVLIE